MKGQLSRQHLRLHRRERREETEASLSAEREHRPGGGPARGTGLPGCTCSHAPRPERLCTWEEGPRAASGRCCGDRGQAVKFRSDKPPSPVGRQPGRGSGCAMFYCPSLCVPALNITEAAGPPSGKAVPSLWATQAWLPGGGPVSSRQVWPRGPHLSKAALVPSLSTWLSPCGDPTSRFEQRRRSGGQEGDSHTCCHLRELHVRGMR